MVPQSHIHITIMSWQSPLSDIWLEKQSLVISWAMRYKNNMAYASSVLFISLPFKKQINEIF